MRFFLFVMLIGVATTASAQSPLSATERQRAKQAFLDGRSAYDLGQYEAALEKFELAYEITEAPELLYNMGQAADRAGDDDKAIAAFEQYLVTYPKDPNRQNIENRIKALRIQVEKRKAEAIKAETAARAAAEAQNRVDELQRQKDNAFRISRKKRVRRAAWISAATAVAAGTLTAVLLTRETGTTGPSLPNSFGNGNLQAIR